MNPLFGNPQLNLSSFKILVCDSGFMKSVKDSASSWENLSSDLILLYMNIFKMQSGCYTSRIETIDSAGGTFFEQDKEETPCYRNFQ